ncbi:MAG: glycosyltransferase [Pirellulaceae bacterium]|nr:glycosyltransferase [Pirellulaceae bacterium]
MKQRVTLVVPCYNEEQRFQSRAFSEFAGQSPSIRFLFVNDGSTDRTETILKGLCQENGRQFAYLGLAKNSGKAEAVRQGLCEALTQKGDIVGFWDADLAAPLGNLVDLLPLFENYPSLEIVLGSRFPLAGRVIQRKASRAFLGRCFSKVASTLCGLKLYDSQCGAKLFRVTPTLTKLFSHPFQSSWIFDVEFLARHLALKETTSAGKLKQDIWGTIYEHPLRHWHEVKGSKLRSRDFLVAAGELLKIWWSYSKWNPSRGDHLKFLDSAHDTSLVAERTPFDDHPEVIPSPFKETIPRKVTLPSKAA